MLKYFENTKEMVNIKVFNKKVYNHLHIYTNTQIYINVYIYVYTFITMAVLKRSLITSVINKINWI